MVSTNDDSFHMTTDLILESILMNLLVLFLLEVPFTGGNYSAGQYTTFNSLFEEGIVSDEGMKYYQVFSLESSNLKDQLTSLLCL